MKIQFTNFNSIFLISIISLLIGNMSCQPDKADIITVVVKKINVEDTLNNRMIMEFENGVWESNSSAKVYYAAGGIEFDASKWVDTNKTVETMKFFIKNNKQTGKFYVQNIDPDANYGIFQIYPFSSPIPDYNYNSESGFVNIIRQTDTNLVGTFEVTLINLKSEKRIVKNGKFNLKFVD